jgi:hypothetical protein
VPESSVRLRSEGKGKPPCHQTYIPSAQGRGPDDVTRRLFEPAGGTSGISATPQVLLGHHPKALKLPTFVREYDKVARQCAAEGVDHVRYLLRLAELEIDREQRLVERRMRATRFPAVKSLDSYDFTALPSLNKTLVLDLARCEYKQRPGLACRGIRTLRVARRLGPKQDRNSAT